MALQLLFYPLKNFNLQEIKMFIVQQLSKPNDSGVRQVQIVDAEWDYRSDKFNWERAMSFLPNWGTIKIRADKHGNVTIEYFYR